MVDERLADLVPSLASMLRPNHSNHDGSCNGSVQCNDGRQLKQLGVRRRRRCCCCCCCCLWLLRLLSLLLLLLLLLLLPLLLLLLPMQAHRR